MTHVHFIGIGGSGLSAIARLLLESGYTVTGSDRVYSSFAEEVERAGATVFRGHHADNIAGADWVVRSSAVPEENIEVRAARAAGIPVYKRADFLGELMAEKRGIAIAGTHGKTTTTAMLAWVLSELGKDPSFIIGGIASNFGTNAHAGRGNYFIIEADEYDRMFLGLTPKIEIVTNVEHDHPDCYPSKDAFFDAFRKFVHRLPKEGLLIACKEDEGAREMLAEAQSMQRETIGYGFRGDSTLQADSLVPNERGGFDFLVRRAGTPPVSVSLQVPGKHNVLNALAVLSVIAWEALSLENAADALSRFTGTGRRFEFRGEAEGILIYDDYAHHPTEIRATLAAARARHPGKRIWAVWQPHTYSRTRTLFDKFLHAFDDADEVIVSEIYAAREPQEDFSAAQLVAAMTHPSARFIASFEDILDYLLRHLQSGDVLLVLSAGDANVISAQVLHALSERTV